MENANAKQTVTEGTPTFTVPLRALFRHGATLRSLELVRFGGIFQIVCLVSILHLHIMLELMVDKSFFELGFENINLNNKNNKFHQKMFCVKKD